MRSSVTSYYCPRMRMDGDQWSLTLFPMLTIPFFYVFIHSGHLLQGFVTWECGMSSIVPPAHSNVLSRP